MPPPSFCVQGVRYAAYLDEAEAPPPSAPPSPPGVADGAYAIEGSDARPPRPANAIKDERGETCARDA